jgi:chaperone BCS1
MQHLVSRDGEPRLYVVGGSERRIVRCDWNELVLDRNVLSLLRDDFESFFNREEWFRKNRLPFRRGYLLHGPPGNGKSTAVRAMLTSRGLTAYTLRLFDPQTDDSDLERLFEKALKNRPSMVLFEDIDRAFPRTGESKARVSMQSLLNCLDGVGTGEGVVVVATANEPTILDPAFLRRPGRFDRVVHFPNPDMDLREKYFRRMADKPEASNVERAVAESEGFSFAQLREAYVLAGQHAFTKSSEITDNDFVPPIRTLWLSVHSGSKWSSAAGFKPAAVPERANT